MSWTCFSTGRSNGRHCRATASAPLRMGPPLALPGAERWVITSTLKLPLGSGAADPDCCLSVRFSTPSSSNPCRGARLSHPGLRGRQGCPLELRPRGNAGNMQRQLTGPGRLKGWPAPQPHPQTPLWMPATAASLPPSLPPALLPATYGASYRHHSLCCRRPAACGCCPRPPCGPCRGKRRSEPQSTGVPGPARWRREEREQGEPPATRQLAPKSGHRGTSTRGSRSRGAPRPDNLHAPDPRWSLRSLKKKWPRTTCLSVRPGLVHLQRGTYTKTTGAWKEALPSPGGPSPGFATAGCCPEGPSPGNTRG